MKHIKKGQEIQISNLSNELTLGRKKLHIG